MKREEKEVLENKYGQEEAGFRIQNLQNFQKDVIEKKPKIIAEGDIESQKKRNTFRVPAL